jgi:hypothetical protein
MENNNEENQPYFLGENTLTTLDILTFPKWKRAGK